MNIADLRKDYALKTLDEAAVERDPLAQFLAWLSEALSAQVPEPTAMTLSTVDERGRPAGRIVLLKAAEPDGLTFFTNYRSRKGRELVENPYAALLFHWLAPHRQVRIEGGVSRVTPHESDAYFASRPVGSRLGALASPQSETIASRDVLEAEVRALAERHRHGPVPRPPHWGGYRIAPESFEWLAP